MPHIPPPGQAARITNFLYEHPHWSVFWDKRDGLWRVAEDPPTPTCTPKPRMPTR